MTTFCVFDSAKCCQHDQISNFWGEFSHGFQRLLNFAKWSRNYIPVWCMMYDEIREHLWNDRSLHFWIRSSGHIWIRNFSNKFFFPQNWCEAINESFAFHWSHSSRGNKEWYFFQVSDLGIQCMEKHFAELNCIGITKEAIKIETLACGTELLFISFKYIFSV